MKEITISEKEYQQRLDKFLLKYFNKAPKSLIYKLLRKKRIKLNGSKAEGNEMLAAGNRIQLYLADETMNQLMEEKELLPAKRHFGIVYEDDQVLIVNKPAGLLTHPESNGQKDTLIHQILYYLYEKGQYTPDKENTFTPAVCNRLDRNTSGLIIAGKNLGAVQAVNEAIAKKKLDKLYIALVKGKISKEGVLTGYITKDHKQNEAEIFQQPVYGGKEIKTVYRPLYSTADYTLLEIHLITGKSHQIRAHLQSIGHPIIGDRKYGDAEINLIFKKQFGLSNQFLHAAQLVWQDQKGSLAYLAEQELIAPLPELFTRIQNELFKEYRR